MYKITIQTLNGNEKTLYYPGNDEFVVTSANLSLKVGNAGEFTFTVPQSNPLYDEIVDHSIITIYEDNAEIWRGDIQDISQNFDKSLEVYALEDLAWLGDETVAMVAVENQTYAQRFSAVMANYNENQPAKRQFQPGSITSVTTSNICHWEPLYEETLLECIRRCIADNGYLKVRRVTNNGTVTRYIDILLLEDYGQQAQQAIRFSNNLLDFVKEIDNTNFLNVLYPYGKETEENLYGDVMKRIEGTPIQNDASITVFGRHSRTVVFETDSMANLDRLALAYLNRYSQPSLKIRAKAIDLGNIEDISRMHLGDSVRIIAEPFAIDQWDYITNQELDLLNIANNQIELSDAVRVSTLTSQVASQGEEIKDTRTPASVLDEAKRNAWSIIEGDNGGIVTFDVNGDEQIVGIHIANNLDLDQATKAWGWNVNGLVYLHRTYPTDEWQIGIAMTMNGEIVADYITTGEMSADRINGGHIRANLITALNGSTTVGNSTLDDFATDSDIDDAVDAFDNSLDQQSVFNRLTDNSQNEGIYLENDHIYLNVSMVKTGDMSADRIKGGSIYLGDLSSAGMLANCEAVSFTETKSDSYTYYFDIGYSTTGAMGLFVCGTETYNFASDNAELTYKVERTSNGGRSYYTLSTGSLSNGIGRIPWRFDVTSQSASMWYRVTITETNSTNFGMVATIYKANTIIDQEGIITTNLVAKEGCQLGNLFVDKKTIRPDGADREIYYIYSNGWYQYFYQEWPTLSANFKKYNILFCPYLDGWSDDSDINLYFSCLDTSSGDHTSTAVCRVNLYYWNGTGWTLKEYRRLNLNGQDIDDKTDYFADFSKTDDTIYSMSVQITRYSWAENYELDISSDSMMKTLDIDAFEVTGVFKGRFSGSADFYAASVGNIEFKPSGTIAFSEDNKNYGIDYTGFVSQEEANIRTKLTVSSTDDPFIEVQRSTTNFINIQNYQLRLEKDSSNYCVFRGSGSLLATRSGTAYSIAWTTSDRRFKEEIEPLDVELSKNLIDATETKKFKYKDSEGKHYGMIAQEAREILDSLGETDAVLEHCTDEENEMNPRTIDYHEYIPHIINYIKDLRSEIVSLKEEVRILKEEK